jgi:hypothetical protein
MIIQEKIVGFSIVIMASFFVAIGIFFASGNLSKYHFKVEVKRCDSEKSEIIQFDAIGKESKISTFREAVPVLEIGNHRIINVCDYKILEVRDSN